MASPPPMDDDLARGRWMVIQVMRLMGIALVLLGILMARDVVDLAGDANRVAGYIFIGTGLLDVFLMPRILARKWRSGTR